MGSRSPLHFRDGSLDRAVTRGDGVRGDVVTANARVIRSVPLRLRGSEPPSALEVRGEVFLPRSSFARLNESRTASDEEPFANPRNATAGTMKTLDSRVVASRGPSISSSTASPRPRGSSSPVTTRASNDCGTGGSRPTRHPACARISTR